RVLASGFDRHLGTSKFINVIEGHQRLRAHHDFILLLQNTGTKRAPRFQRAEAFLPSVPSVGLPAARFPALLSPSVHTESRPPGFRAPLVLF
ncbi:unnamed protein product, partial [Urochloa humidicola]